MNDQEVRSTLRLYILKDLIRDPKYPLADDEGIVSGGLIDSFALAQIGVYCEREFKVYIPDPDLTVAQMDTLNQMVARVLQG
ncbi:MAG: hypothetical protein H7Y11_02740 [Armatimonadetes bacterium]|nr:hypothetical protein [Anaerolineae bacterium]